MEKISEHYLKENGLKSIDKLDEFEYSYISYGDGKGAEFIQLIKDRDFVLQSQRSEGQDWEVSVYHFRKKTKQEKDYENLELQIKNLEKRFKIKITYTKL